MTVRLQVDLGASTMVHCKLAIRFSITAIPFSLTMRRAVILIILALYSFVSVVYTLFNVEAFLRWFSGNLKQIKKQLQWAK